MLSNFAGINENNKPSSKVLRPPGGGSSDIFGPDAPSTPRSVKNHMQSNIFSCEKGSVKNNGDQPRRGQKNVDSYTRLFGDPERPFTPAKNHMKSSIPFGGVAGTENVKSNGVHVSNGRNVKLENGGSSSSASSMSSSTENLKMNGISKTEPEETSVVSSPRAIVENGNQNDGKVVFNDNLSARSSSSKLSEKTQHDSCSTPLGATENNSEDTRSEVTVTSDSQKTTSGSQIPTPRNPITGLGLGDDGQRARRNMNRREQEETPSAAIPQPPIIENGNENQSDEKMVSNENLSARSLSSKLPEKTQVGESSPAQCAAENYSSEDSKSISSLSCLHKTPSTTSGVQNFNARNPITGLGLGDGDRRARRNMNRRDGNPVTGEGYKPAGAEINTTIPSLNGANQVINKNRIPPGGFSSGLW